MVKAIYVLPVYSAIYSNLPRLLNETQTSDTATVVAGCCLKLPVMLIIPVMFDCMQGGSPKKRSSLSKSVLIRLHSGSAEMMQHMGLSLICWKCACNTLSQGENCAHSIFQNLAICTSLGLLHLEGHN